MNAIDKALNQLENFYNNQPKPKNNEPCMANGSRYRLVDYKGECKETSKRC